MEEEEQDEGNGEAEPDQPPHGASGTLTLRVGSNPSIPRDVVGNEQESLFSTSLHHLFLYFYLIM
jgi:hypothetical protein